MISSLVELISNLFTKNNLESDQYLIANTNSNGAVPIEIILHSPKILNICQDADTIRYALKECKNISISEDGIRAIIKPEQNTLILRDISSTTSADDIMSIFSNLLVTDVDCPQAQSVRPDMNDTWFITFSTEVDARIALETLRARNTHFNDKPVRARLKTESLNKSYYGGNGAAQYRGDLGYSGQISPEYSPPQMQGMPPNVFFPPNGYAMSPPTNFMPSMMQSNLLQPPNSLPMMGYPMMMGVQGPLMQQQWSQPEIRNNQKKMIDFMKKNVSNEYKDQFGVPLHPRNNQNINQRNNNQRNQNNIGRVQRGNNNGNNVNYQQNNNVFFQNQDPNIMMQQQQYLNQGQQQGRRGQGNFNQRNQGGYNNQYFQHFPGQQNQPRSRNQQFDNRYRDPIMPFNDMYLNNESDNQDELKDDSRNNDNQPGDRLNDGDMQLNTKEYINKSVDEFYNRRDEPTLVSNENNSNVDQKGDYQNNKLRKNNKKQDNDLVSSLVNIDRNNKNADKNSDKNKRKDNKIEGKNRNNNGTDKKNTEKKVKNGKKDDKESSKPSVLDFENDFPTFGVLPVGAPPSSSNGVSKNFISGYAAAAIGTRVNYTPIVDNQVKEQIKSNNSNHSESNKVSKDVTNEIKIQKHKQQQQVNIPVISNTITEVVEVSVPVVVVPAVKGNIVQSHYNSPEISITFGAFDNTSLVKKEIVQTSNVTKDNSYNDEASLQLSASKVDEIAQSSGWGNSKRSFLDVVRTAK